MRTSVEQIAGVRRTHHCHLLFRRRSGADGDEDGLLPWISPLQYAPTPVRPPPAPPPPPAPRRRFINHGAVVRLIAGEPDPQRALDIFNAAAEQQPGFCHNNATYAAILRRLAAARRFPAVEALLRRIRGEPCRFEEGAFIPLMRYFSAAGHPEKAVELLHAIPALVRSRRPSPRALAACLDLLVDSRRHDLAAGLLTDARRRYRLRPNTCHLNILLKLHCATGDFPAAFQLLAEMRRSSGAAAAAAPNRITFSTLMAALCRAGRMKAAFELFEEMIAGDGVAPDAVTYNLLIDGFRRQNEPEKAAHVIAFMRAHNCDPNAVNYSTLMAALCRAGRLNEAMQILADMKKQATSSSSSSAQAAAPDAVCYTTVISCLCREGRVDEAVELAREMEERGCEPDPVTCNVVVGGLCRAGRAAEAAALLEKLAGERRRVNRASYRILLNRLLWEGELERAAALLGAMLERKMLPHFAASNELLVELCEEGRVAEAAAALRGLAAAGFAPAAETWLRLVRCFCRERKLPRSLDLLDCLAAAAVDADLLPA